MIFHRQRGERRTNIAVKARLRIGSYDCEATLVNAASRGVLALLGNPPVRGTRVQVVVGELRLAGVVRWRAVDCCGIALAEPISVPELIDGHGAASRMARPPRGLRGRFRALVGERG